MHTDGIPGLVGVPSECWCRLLPEIYDTHDGCHARIFEERMKNEWNRSVCKHKSIWFCWNWYRSHILSLPSRSTYINSFNFTSNSETRKPPLFPTISNIWHPSNPFFSYIHFFSVQLHWPSPLEVKIATAKMALSEVGAGRREQRLGGWENWSYAAMAIPHRIHGCLVYLTYMKRLIFYGFHV